MQPQHRFVPFLSQQTGSVQTMHDGACIALTAEIPIDELHQGSCRGQCRAGRPHTPHSLLYGAVSLSSAEEYVGECVYIYVYFMPACLCPRPPAPAAAADMTVWLFLLPLCVMCDLLCVYRSHSSDPLKSDDQMRFIRELWRRRLSGVQRNVEVGEPEGGGGAGGRGQGVGGRGGGIGRGTGGVSGGN